MTLLLPNNKKTYLYLPDGIKSSQIYVVCCMTTPDICQGLFNLMGLQTMIVTHVNSH